MPEKPDRPLELEDEPDESRRIRNIVLLLAGSVALMMTGFGIIMPVFARRLGEMGGGVETLGLLTMSFALAQLIAGPIMGAVADRRGRRPVILLALAAFACANVGYLIAGSPLVFILVRSLGGAFTSGLFPASMGIVADTVPEQERAKWVGIVTAGYGAGFIVGPALGGVLYDGWGYAAPFLVSAVMGALAFAAAAVFVPETHRPERVRRERAGETAPTEANPRPKEGLSSSLPRPLYVFGTLLFLDFLVSFAFAFVEPQMVFYFYNDLKWTTIQFGVVISGYGLTMVLGQAFLSQLSDRFGRKPVIVFGLIMDLTFYVSLIVFGSFRLLLIGAVVSGLGAALLTPAVSAFYLDITPDAHRSRIMGIRGSALSLGGIIGPLLVVAASRIMSPIGIFSVAASMLLFGVLLAFSVLKDPLHTKRKPDAPIQPPLPKTAR